MNPFHVRGLVLSAVAIAAVGLWGDAVAAPQAREVRAFHRIDFVWIPPGTFVMGSPASEDGRDGDEGPQHEVTLSKGFWLGVYEVTAGQFLEFLNATRKDSGILFDEYCPISASRYHLGGNSFGSDARQPMCNVSWNACVAFCDWLTSKGDSVYRLPTEAEWEYACRAGTTAAFSFGTDKSLLGEYAWHAGNSRDVTHPVGEKKPNPWGLCDMHGNVCEWCHDWYGEYGGGAVTDPAGPSSGSRRVLRGGSWTDSPGRCRSAGRYSDVPYGTHHSFGFRVVREGD